MLGDDGGLNVSEDNGATFTSDKNYGLVSHLYYTISGNPQFPNLAIGGLQDNGTRLRTDNGTVFNQMNGGDGLGAAYSQNNTNTVLYSAQGSMPHELQQQRPRVHPEGPSATSGLSDSAGAGFSTAIIPAPAGLDPTGRVFFHFTNARVWKTTTAVLDLDRADRARLRLEVTLARPAATSTTPFPFHAVQPRREPDRHQPHRRAAPPGYWMVTTNGGTTWTDINLIRPWARLQGFRLERDLAGQPERLDHLGGPHARRDARDQGGIANPGDSGRRPPTRCCRTACRTCP